MKKNAITDFILKLMRGFFYEISVNKKPFVNLFIKKPNIVNRRK